MDTEASLKLKLHALKDSVTAHKPSDALKQRIRHRRSCMAEVLTSHHYKMPAGEDWKEIFHGAPGSTECDERIGRTDLFCIDTNIGVDTEVMDCDIMNQRSRLR